MVLLVAQLGTSSSVMSTSMRHLSYSTTSLGGTHTHPNSRIERLIV